MPARRGYKFVGWLERLFEILGAALQICELFTRGNCLVA